MVQAQRLLFDGFFQWGYVTRDLDAAVAQFNRRFGPVEFQINVNTHPVNRATSRYALGWHGALMAEIIEVNEAVTSLYSDFLPASRSDIRFHHLGYLVSDHAATLHRLRQDGYAIPFAYSEDPTVVSMCYADARAQLGHYLEYICLGPTGRQWFASVPGFKGFPA
jgi:hypothetical protein